MQGVRPRPYGENPSLPGPYENLKTRKQENMSTSRQVFSPSQRELLDAVLDRIIPTEGNRPGAGAVGIGDFVESVAVGEPGLIRLFMQGLAAIEIAAAERGAEGFVALADEAKDASLRSVEASHTNFFDQLVLQVYNGYYTDLTVFDAIGYSVPLPPAPGVKLELLDETLLEAQRQRPPFWTRV